MVTGFSQIHRGANATRLYLLEGGSSAIFTYDAGTNAFSRAVNTGYPMGNAAAAVNPDGSMIATRYSANTFNNFNRGVSLESAGDFGFRRFFNDLDSGIA